MGEKNESAFIFEIITKHINSGLISAIWAAISIA